MCNEVELWMLNNAIHYYCKHLFTPVIIDIQSWHNDLH